MKENVEWLGTMLRRRYENSLVKPANWRLINELANLDEQAEAKAAQEAEVAKAANEAKKPDRP